MVEMFKAERLGRRVRDIDPPRRKGDPPKKTIELICDPHANKPIIINGRQYTEFIYPAELEQMAAEEPFVHTERRAMEYLNTQAQLKQIVVTALERLKEQE